MTPSGHVLMGGVHFADSGQAVTFFARAPGYRRGPPAPESVAREIVGLREGAGVEWFVVEFLGTFLARSDPGGLT